MPRNGFVPWNKKPESLRRAVVTEYQKGGRTRKSIADEFGISPSSLTHWVGPSKKKKDQEKRKLKYKHIVEEMYWEGWTYHHIARETGIPVQTVWDWINRFPSAGKYGK